MGAKILIIDHNDSFTYNLVGLFESFAGKAGLVESIKVCPVGDLAGIDLMNIWQFDGVVLSPGPGLPEDYPAVTALLRVCLDGPRQMPVLGICLGLQALVCYFGGALYNLPMIQHGRQVELIIEFPGATARPVSPLFKELRLPFKVGLYHSWGMDTNIHIQNLEILATATLPGTGVNYDVGSASSKRVVMAIGHQSLPVYGLQFHPESYMTPEGHIVIRNWLETLQLI